MELKDYFRMSIEVITHEGLKSFFKKAIKVIINRIKNAIKNKLAYPPRPVLKIRTPNLKAMPIVKQQGLPCIDIIIITYNSRDYILRCIESIQASRYPAEKISIIIVDNNSTDGTNEVIKVIQSKVRNCTTIESTVNLGFGRANNLGFKAATNKYILFLNPDTTLEADTLSCLVNMALASVEDGFGAWEARQKPYEHPKLYDPVTLETEWVSGACVLMLRESFEKVNGFDANIFLYGEDVDLSWRLRGVGYKLQYIPAAVVNHFTYSDETFAKPTQFLGSIVSNGILRFKFGRFKDIVTYFLNLIGILVRPPKIKKARFKLIKLLFTMIPNIKRALACRVAQKNRFLGITPRFNGWDYEIRRRGAFYITKVTEKRPLVSIIIRTIQRPYFLREALQSVRNQTYRPIEVIVIEDSMSASEKTINEFTDLDIRYIATGKRVGRCRAGNLGLENANGKYINFLDDDDAFFADHVEVLIGELETDTSGRLAAYSLGLEIPTNVISTDPFKYEEVDYCIVYDKPFDFAALRKGNYIPINCMLFSRDLFLKEGGFDETLDLLEDWDLWIRYANYTDFIFVEKTTCIYRVPPSAKTVKNREKLMLKAYQSVCVKHKLL